MAGGQQDSQDSQDSQPQTVRYVTRTGLFAEILAPGRQQLEEARRRLAAMTEDERREAAARYLAGRYGGLAIWLGRRRP